MADRNSVESTMADVDMISIGDDEITSPTNIDPKAANRVAVRIFCNDFCVLHPRNRRILVLSMANGRPR
jgi:hypothetical protein